MSDQLNPKIDPILRDVRISHKARTTRQLEKIAKHGTDEQKRQFRKAAFDRDQYIDAFAGQP